MKQVARTALRGLAALTPNVRLVRAVPSRVLTPLHRRLALGGGVVDVLGFRMKLDPNECVDAGLWYAPHLYDSQELAFLRQNFRGGTFVDLGANIGFWSACVAHHWPQAEVLAVEANPSTFSILTENLALNGFDRVKALNVGAAETDGVLPLYLNETGNRGGDSLKNVAGDRRAVEVPVKRLSQILQDQGVSAIEFMKMDIEGMELEVLTELFANAPQTVWPTYLCAETAWSPDLAGLVHANGYSTVLTGRDNTVFHRSSTSGDAGA